MVRKVEPIMNQQTMYSLNAAARQIQDAANKARVPLEDFSAELQEHMQALAKVNLALSVDDAQRVIDALSSSIVALRPNTQAYVDSFDKLVKLRDEIRSKINETLEYIRRHCNQ